MVAYYLNWQNKLLKFYDAVSEHIKIQTFMVDPIRHRDNYSIIAASLVK